jgi:short-subunit dehydrogenase
MEFIRRYGPWALVTGASSGLGEQFAHALAQRGLNLVLVARRLDRLERLAADLRRERRIQTRVIALDLAQPDAAQQLEAALAGTELGLLVNNAGFGWQGSFLAQDPAEITRMVRVNCEAPALIARLLLPRLAARGSGGMVVVASTSAYQGVPGMSVYGASKGFDLLLGEALAVELSSSGIDVITVAPGHTATEFHAIAGVTKGTTGPSARPEEVVKETLERLGRKHSFVHGRLNRLLVFLQRFGTRRLAASVAGRLIRSRGAPQ